MNWHSSNTWLELQQFQPYLFQSECWELQRLVQSLEREMPIVVNIGAGAGLSGIVIYEARSDSLVVTIDIEAETSPFGGLGNEKAEFDKRGYGGAYHHQICADSVRAARTWTLYEFVDMVFVDGDHSYEGCKADIESWLPRVRPGGIIAIHDYDKGNADWSEDPAPHPKEWPGVTRAVDELLVDQYRQISRVQSLISFQVEGKDGT